MSFRVSGERAAAVRAAAAALVRRALAGVVFSPQLGSFPVRCELWTVPTTRKGPWLSKSTLDRLDPKQSQLFFKNQRNSQRDSSAGGHWFAARSPEWFLTLERRHVSASDLDDL